MDFTQEKFSKYLFWGAIIILIFLSFKIIQPYIVAILSAFILTYLIKPIYDFFTSKQVPSSIAAILCIIIVAILILIPVAFIVGSIISQASLALQFQDVTALFNQISSHPLIDQLHLDVESIRAKGLNEIAALFGLALASLPRLALSALILVFGMFHMLTHWSVLTKTLTSLIPFKDKKSIALELDRTTRTIVRGTLLVAACEFVVAAFGFWISGVSTYLLLAAAIFIFAFIPGLGPVAVWAPLALYHLAIQNYPTAIGVITTGLVISIFFDTFLLSKFVGDHAKINPFVMILGIIGGVTLLGIFGFIIGPLILVYTTKLIHEGLDHS